MGDKIVMADTRPPEFVVTITASSEGLYALTSYGKIWQTVDATGYPPDAWYPVALPPLVGGK